ncbi:hypothetical protein AB4455_26160 [Vibrio sp. 10N.261.46.E12]|nr:MULTISPECIES: hypothetical protein [unclassified Vibrio]OMO36941.1 hypothetical protein BH584_24360 [Vibrio sp. 10N.261.45.E1]PMJ36313.1 hypothetical protein BCU27_02240 [Vibrio sp. 10N.286.45.B6]PML93778.1 hypothetical protein BCT66_24195 [Vibrio sp. 10N.261.49.E11]PMM83216.1 hypothetical protein BCT46_12765 [Vibrio sp. 10N.261.46.E8]PMN48908.1 hypothetical protein BCT32_06830 [Vibrio sp. 10N.261.45.E11]
MRFGQKAREAFKAAQQSGEDFDEVVIDTTNLVKSTHQATEISKDITEKANTQATQEAAPTPDNSTEANAQSSEEATVTSGSTAKPDTQSIQEAKSTTNATAEADVQAAQEATVTTDTTAEAGAQAAQEATVTTDTTAEAGAQAAQEATVTSSSTAKPDTQTTKETTATPETSAEVDAEALQKISSNTSQQVQQNLIDSLSGTGTPTKENAIDPNFTNEQLLLIEKVGMFNRSLENIYNIAAIPHKEGKVLSENTNVDVKFKEQIGQINNRIASLNELNLGSHYLYGELVGKKNNFHNLLEKIVERREEKKNLQRSQQEKNTIDNDSNKVIEPTVTAPKINDQSNDELTPSTKVETSPQRSEEIHNIIDTDSNSNDENSPDRIALVNPKYQLVNQSSLSNAQASFDNKDYGNRFIAKQQTPVHALVNTTRIKEVKSSFFLRDIHTGQDLTEHYCEHHLLRNGSIKDYGNMFDFTGTNRKANAKMAIKLANKMGWNTIACSGNPKFMSELGSLASKYGIQVIPIDTRNNIQAKSISKSDMAEVSKQMSSQTPNATSRNEHNNQKSTFQNAAKKTAEGTVDLAKSTKGDNCLSNILKEEVNPKPHNPIVRNMN